MKHIILGDVHLGRSVSVGKPAISGDRLNSRIEDQLFLLNWVREYAVKNKIEHIIITGDIYQDPRPHPALIAFFMSWLLSCQSKNIFVDIIAGNHDIIRTGNYTVSALDVVPAVQLQGTKVHKNISSQEYGKLKIFYVPYRDRRMYEVGTANEALDILINDLNEHELGKNKNIIIGHLSLKGTLKVTDEVVDSLNEIFVPAESLSKYDSVFMGHIHHPQTVSEKNPFAMHVGSMDRSDFHVFETDISKRIIILDEDGSWKEEVLPTRNMYHIDIEVPKESNPTDYVTESIRMFNQGFNLKDAIVRLSIDLVDGEIDRPAVENYLYNNMSVHHICGFSESRAIAEIKMAANGEEFDNAISPEIAINKFADSRDDFKDEVQKARFKTIAYECLGEVK